MVPKIKRWLPEKTVVWDRTTASNIIEYVSLAMAIISVLVALLPFLAVAYHRKQRKPIGSNSALYTKSDQVAGFRVSGANPTAGRHAQKKRHVGHPLRTLDIV
jgi:hypothetical protein